MDLENKRYAGPLNPGIFSQVGQKIFGKQLYVVEHNGERQLFDIHKIYKTIAWAARDYQDDINADEILQEVIRSIYDGISSKELLDALILATTVFIERDPAYSYVSAQLLLKKNYMEVTGLPIEFEQKDLHYRKAFTHAIMAGVQADVLDKRMLEFDIEYLAQQLQVERDSLLDFMGLKTLSDRYFIKIDGGRSELPQIFWMRVAMGLSLNEENQTAAAAQFYHLMSQLRYLPSTPTLLHAGLKLSQLSSCFLTTVKDDLHHIFKCISDNAQMAKWSGGVANDWTPVRATGSYIKSINVESQGVIPFLKVANDTTASINRSGKRRGASVVYLETWHYDIEDFLDLKKNTGDERRRTHDINTANWIPDLFMKRIEADAHWTLFSPDDVPDLHDLYGKAFESRYVAYERLADEGKIRLTKRIPAVQLWRKMISRLFETGHPWVTFKDAFNIRSPQDHVGVIHSTNLCTEISLNNSAKETAVCNIGSINLALHIVDGQLNEQLLAESITTAMRMLDNVIDITYYPIEEGRVSNMRHRPIGLGIMGFQDALYKVDVPFDDARAIELADEWMEFVSYHAILASSQLAAQRGAYSTFKGSKWDRGILPHDTLDLLEAERDLPVEVKRGGKLDWTPVRQSIRQHGMRNSNTMAIAPTATISTISHCYPCIEPIYKNLYVKANMSGEFTVVNSYLVADLKKIGLWDQHMLDQLKYYDGNVQMIAEIPDHLKHKYKEAFELDPEYLIGFTAVRGKWIDQSQSHNVFMQGASGKKLHNVYFKAWKSGLKATYYLRTLGATQIEKSTLEASRFGFTQKREYSTLDMKVAVQQDVVLDAPTVTMTASLKTDSEVMCSILNGPDCDACQ